VVARQRESERPADGTDRSRATPPSPRPLKPRGDAPAPLVFHRGAHAPYATRWFGVTSLAGHARNFVASAIAAESIDSRDWMRPAPSDELLQHCARVLGEDLRSSSARTLTEALGRAVWVDFVADTGDDHDVSLAVARMLFEAYSIEEDGRERTLPRGDVLLFGGDTAYPVATGEEIARRVVVPWNEVLRERGEDGVGRRVLLGIAGNHDWYDGLDGFGRLFRRKPYGASGAAGPEEAAPPPVGATRRRRVKRRTGIAARQLHLDEVGSFLAMFASAWRTVRAFVSGSKVVRPRRLALVGYDPVQEASYWALPLAPGLEAWGVDRQLGRLDFRQRQFFAERRRSLSPDAGVLFVAPDPAVAFGEKHEPGARMLSACRMSLETGRIFYLTGDMHHYERRAPGERSVHVIAGGGGAFLHGTRISRSPSGPAACAWPTASMSRRLVAQVPFKLMAGTSGFIVHLAFALVASLELSASARGTAPLVAAACLVAVCLAGGLYANVGHNRGHPIAVASIAIPFGAVLGLTPMGLRLALPRIVPAVDWDIGVVIVVAFLGAFAIGLFLALIAVLGFEHQQAFSVLSHPGFKHFVRLCVHPDGRIEAWTIGKDDPLGKADPVLVDRFEWR
jgi:hypothetical protein